jgi:monofunctional biosynthetic peptidoglycan transglycosylase
MGADDQELTLFDFRQAEADPDWRTINDTVMGGRSSSQVEIGDSGLVFSGKVSLENDGGFCSARSNTGGWDLSEYAGIAVSIRTGDRSFVLTARDEPGTDTVGYHHALPVTGDEWQTVHALFADFEATYHGRVLEDDPGLNTEQVRSVGFLIGEGQEGPFRLEVAWIAAYGEA